MQCPSCGARLSRPGRFCDQCGAQLAPREAAPVEAPAAGDIGDRRVVTALFADLVDYVRMLAEHDPEEVRARVGRALVRMGDAIERLGGTREKFIGDAVFAVFGWPQAHDDDPSGLPWRHWRSAPRCSSPRTAASRWRFGSASPPERWWRPREATAQATRP